MTQDERKGLILCLKIEFSDGLGGYYHLLLLDIIMPEQDGMALARQLRQQEIKTSLIFISNSREMALRGYEVNAQRYLVKPIDESLLREAFGAAF